ncbi:MAG TPA: N-6 DNA methylase, partial [Phenylobacterium sp.]
MANETAQKLRGGYYTPADLAGFIARWIAGSAPKRILEPSCGDGAFVQAIGETPGLAGARVTGFEIDHAEATKARLRAQDLSLAADIQASDFLGWALERFDRPAFDAVVGNPPYIRYQYLPPQHQARAEAVSARLNLRFTRHANAWTSFVLAGLRLLTPGGRLAMVLPAELIQVMHAAPLRAHLLDQCRRLVLIDPRELWFDGALQGAVILLAEKAHEPGDRREGLAVIPVAGRSFARACPETLFREAEPLAPEELVGKWTGAFLPRATRSLFAAARTQPGVRRFEEVAGVDVGIVTGANGFFLVDDAVVERHGLAAFAHPMFGRSEHAPGLIYDAAQHRANAAKGSPTNFLWFRNDADGAAANDYIAQGEAQGLHTRFKCRIRKPWYAVPSVHAAPVGMLKRAHTAPRLILNALGAYTTDTAYRIRPKGPDAAQLVAAFVNPLTALSAELEGRGYGGGVLELVPSEIEKLLVPLPESALDLPALDAAVRTRPHADV